MRYKAIILLVALASICASLSGVNKPHDSRIVSSRFISPTTEYRTVPLYSFNDQLDTAVIRAHVKDFANAGCGGVNLHARTGLLSTYLDDEWWAAIDAGVKASEEYGIKAWFYDEDKWPSGFAGGHVTLKNQDHIMQFILKLDKSVGVYKDTDKIIASDDKYNYVLTKLNMGNAWFDGATYSDLLDPDVVRSFIDIAYAPYVDRYKDKIGTVAPGIFTDEPQVSPRPEVPNSGSVIYTPSLYKTFKQMHGYDLEPKIISLFYERDDYKKVRYDYYRTIAHLFETSFAKQIGEYCAENNLIFQGHFNGEETLSSITRNSGNHMAMYRHMQMPGMDMLGLNHGTLNAPKSISSVANQYDIQWRMSESFGISGHNMSFEDRKWILDWQTNTGINFIVPHLALYSMKGDRKRDYPPTFNQQPYWKYNKIFEDYSARMCYAMSTGRYAAEIAVVHPLESGYIDMDVKDFTWGSDRNSVFYDLLNQLQNNHSDYDLADEQIMSEIAEIKNNGVQIGKMNYKVLILPDMLTIRESTLKILDEFHKNGGSILVLKTYPTLVDGVESPEKLKNLKDISKLVDQKGIISLLNQAYDPLFTFTGDKASTVWTHARKTDKGGYTIQLSNISRKDGLDGVLRFKDNQKNIAIWDATTGKSYALVPDSKGDIHLKFAQAQSWIITTGDASADADLSQTYSFKKHVDKVVKNIDGDWSGYRVDPNAITIDFASYSIDNGKTFFPSQPVLGIHKRLHKMNYNGNLILKYEINSDITPKNCSLVMEQPEMYESVTLNNRKIEFKDNGFYVDHAFRKMDISKGIVKGKNEVTLTLNYVAPIPSDLDAHKRYGTEIESIYIIGDFGVASNNPISRTSDTERNQNQTLVSKPVNSFKDFKITAENKKFSEDLTHQGYPFFAGEFMLEKSFKLDNIDPSKKYFIVLSEPDAIVIKANVNGKEIAEPIVFHPQEIDVTGLLKNGNNTITLSLTNSLRNLLGPHHHKRGELISVGAQSFAGESTWTSPEEGDDDWYDVRLTGQPKIWRDEYFIIPFGLSAEPQVVERSEL